MCTSYLGGVKMSKKDFDNHKEKDKELEEFLFGKNSTDKIVDEHIEAVFNDPNAFDRESPLDVQPKRAPDSILTELLNLFGYEYDILKHTVNENTDFDEYAEKMNQLNQDYVEKIQEHYIKKEQYDELLRKYDEIKNEIRLELR